ncbi:MAG: adenylosuccinate lyase [Candidatus Promineifilaceae bacterium]|jgi:adenylosuccinate lyase
MFDFDSYISPFSWRYGSQEMRHIWSEEQRRRLMRRIWVSLATAQYQAGLVTEEQLNDLKKQVDNVNIKRAMEVEKELRHDVMAEIHVYAEQAPLGGPILHWGATSADIIDNADVLRQKEALQFVLHKLAQLLLIFAAHIEDAADLQVMAYTHIQPAEPTTLGYRFAIYAQDLLQNYLGLRSLLENLRGKGMKGAVGTQASFQDILAETQMSALEMEAIVMQALDLSYFPITTQTYTRQQDLTITQLLASLAASLHKFALDFRILQSPSFGEWAEPFGKKQVGSSAMPFKRNPINTENICSLARYIAASPAVMWDNASQAILERSLDDSANRRIVLAEAFLAADELLDRTVRVVREIRIDEQMISRNMALYGPFAATERLMMAMVANGADRQQAHEWLRQDSLQAWEYVRRGDENSLQRLVNEDERIRHYLTEEQIVELMDVSTHTGTAAIRARNFAEEIKATLAEAPDLLLDR